MVSILAIETSTAMCSVALVTADQKLQLIEHTPRKHTEFLLPMVQDILQQWGGYLSDLNYLAFGEGPGSFMGVRLAFSVAQGLSWAHALPVIPVSSLAAMAMKATQEVGLSFILPGLDARMGELYWGGYCYEDGLLTTLIPDQLTRPQDFILPADQQWVGVGSVWESDLISAQAPHSVLRQDLYPEALYIAVLASQNIQKAQLPEALVPCYYRSGV
jgi:tRNA threonylcarbamoyladenosine biosynthesis protein TsaB